MNIQAIPGCLCLSHYLPELVSPADSLLPVEPRGSTPVSDSGVLSAPAPALPSAGPALAGCFHRARYNPDLNCTGVVRSHLQTTSLPTL